MVHRLQNLVGLCTPLGRHQMTINGKTDGFTLAYFRACAGTAGLKRGRDQEILAEIVKAVRQWPRFAREAGVLRSQQDPIAYSHRLEFGQPRVRGSDPGK